MKELIMERIGCSGREADMIVEDLNKICPQLKPILEVWCRTGEIDEDYIYDGYSLTGLMRDYDMKFTGALLTMDWLIKEPNEAKKALKYGVR